VSCCMAPSEADHELGWHKVQVPTPGEYAPRNDPMLRSRQGNHFDVRLFRQASDELHTDI